MAKSRVPSGLGSKLFAAMSLLVAFSAGVGTLLVEFTKMDYSLALVPFWPGLLAHMLLTGFHGGTVMEERFAPWLAAFTNAAFYTLVIIVCRATWRFFMSRPTAYRQNPERNER